MKIDSFCLRYVFLILVSFYVIGEGTAQASETFYAGFSSRKISPEIKSLKKEKYSIGAYFLSRAMRIHDDLYVRTVLIADAGKTNPITITVLDAAGIGNQLIHKAKQRAHKATGVPIDSMRIAATHTHSAPDLQGVYGGCPESYRDFVVQQIVDSMIEAHSKMRPANLSVTRAIGENKNRRDWPMTDQEITLLDFHDAGTGDRLGTLFNFAAHPVVMKNDGSISRDFPGYLVDKAERDLGGISLFVNGIVGDIKGKVKTWGGPALAEKYANDIVARAMAELPSSVPVSPPLIVTQRKPYKALTDNLLYKLSAFFGMLYYDLGWGKWGRLKIQTSGSYFRLGEQVQAVTSPGESLTRMGLPVKSAMEAPYRMFLGLTDDTLGYLVPSDEWRQGRNGNYEEKLALNKYAADDIRDHLIAMVEQDNLNF